MSSGYLTLLPYLGNKARLLSPLGLMFPSWCEFGFDLFGGSGSVSLNTHYRFKGGLTYNELDPDVFRLFSVLKDSTSCNEFFKLVVNMDYSKEAFERAKACKEAHFAGCLDEATKAAITFQLYSCSFMAMGTNWTNRIGKLNEREIRDKRLSMESNLQKVAQAAEKFDVQNRDAFSLLLEIKDDPKNFIYADIPYPNTTSSYAKNCCWSEEQHMKFAYMILDSDAAIAVSCYSSDLYDSILSKGGKWHKFHIGSLPTPSQQKGSKKEMKEEYLYINYTKLHPLTKGISMEVPFFQTVQACA